MTGKLRSGICLLVMMVGLGTVACKLRRPDTAPARMIEPQLLQPQQAGPAAPVSKAANAAPVRLLETQALGHIGRPLLHQQASGELAADPVWRWSSAPDRYLDTALQLEAASNPNVRLVDAARATALAATLIVWDLEPREGTRLVGAVEFQIMGDNNVVLTKVVRDSEPINTELPGNLAVAAGNLLRRLASEGLKLAVSQPPAPTTSRQPR
ncbi:MAG TPA: hypothetical protein VF532_23670 [Candidatus Angelobacter sp.]